MTTAVFIPIKTMAKPQQNGNDIFSGSITVQFEQKGRITLEAIKNYQDHIGSRTFWLCLELQNKSEIYILYLFCVTATFKSQELKEKQNLILYMRFYKAMRKI